MSSNTSEPTRTASQVELAESGEGMLANDGEDEACADIDIEISVTELERIGDPRTPALLRLRDKIVFVAGVANVLLLAFLLHGEPWIMPWYYIVKAPLLLSIRIYLYFQQKFQYFLLDFCYWANLLLWIYLVFLPSNKQLFTVVYAIAHGPLAWAVMLFHNSLVFHSLDKTTSAFIHISPVLVTYCIRWFGEDFPENENYGVCDPDDSDCASFTWTAVVPAVFYVAWIVVYGILIRFIFPVPNPDYLTSYRWLTRPKSGPVRFLANQKLGWVIYAIGNIIIAFLMLCPVILCYRYQLANLIFGIFIVLVAIWNGAGYYINVFSKKYSASIENELNKVTSPVC